MRRLARAGWLGGVAAALLWVGVTGCHSGAGAPAAEMKSYHLRGKIVSVDAGSGSITVSHEAIPGLMGAMTMPYKLAEPNIASELHPGDVITARLLADEDAAGPLHLRLDHLVVLAQAKPDYKPTVQYHVPSPGDAVPDFRLLDQSGKMVDLKQYRGKVLLMTFIYTRCPLADFCPKMSSNFATIDQALASDRQAYAHTHLLSVSFDPAYDTPAVLRSYGGAHTGRFTHEDFGHWTFAAPPAAELHAMEQWFDVGVTGRSSEPSTLQHSLSTVLIGKDGRVIAWYPTNDWRPEDLVARAEEAAK